jgi:tetratricopeptide (TPR) repeat protein
MRRFSRVPLIVPAMVLLCAPLAQGADDDVQALSAGALTAMDAGKWPEALDLLDRCVTRYDAGALQRFGPSFGVSWYRKGVCELKLQKWQDAAQSFQKCYQDYPNRSRDVGNPYNKRALLRWGEALQGAGDAAGAIRLYNKFLAERDKTDDTFQPASFYIGMALCQFATGKVADGVFDFETALKNRGAFGTPDNGIAAAFRALANATIQAKDEKLLTGFIERNRGDLIVAPADMEPCVELFLALGAETAAAGMPVAAAAFYGLIPDAEVMIEDLRSRLERPAGLDVDRLKRYQAALAGLEEQRRQDTTCDVTRLAATAALLEKQGDLRGAFACYQLLERFHPRSPQREENLFQLVRTAILTGQTLQADQYAAAFATAFPQSKKSAEIRRTMLAMLFQAGDYEACARSASRMLKDFPDGSHDQDACLYFLAGSDYYLGRNQDAAALIDQHIAKYPQSEFRQMALWFQASARSRSGKTEEAAALLDAFLAAYPDGETNLCFPYALFERAACYAGERQWPQALEKLDRLSADFPRSEVAEAANSLRGQVLASLQRNGEAEQAYRKAAAIARERGHESAASEALLELVDLLGEEKDLAKADKEILSCADQFWKFSATAPAIAHRFAIVQAEPLARAGRRQEALDRLERTIAAADCSAADCEEAACRFWRLYLPKHSPDELREVALHFPGLTDGDKKAQAQVRGMAIAALDDPEKRKEAGWEAKASPVLTALFQDLKNRCAPGDFPTALLVRMGDFLRTTTSAPRQALPFYEEVLKRPDEGLHGRALLGRAAVLAQGSDGERAEALQTLDHGRNHFTSLSPAEQGIWRQVETMAGRRGGSGIDQAH